MSLLLEIITPEKIVYKDEVDEVIIPTVNGEIAVLPHHVNLLSQIIPGELIIKKGEKTESIAITGGFLDVNKNGVSILADYAIKAGEIEVAKAKEAQERAERLMREKSTEKDFRIAEAELRKAILELRVATKHKRRLV
ncbi:MAG: ATP synthase F1 subunit epsilon [Candidatus Levybacteria bacterium]|nr:ATP synthase F1 subunit epsilon [Candidatus Levybacteria bacterium]